VVEKIFSRGATVVKFYFTSLKLRQKLIEKHEIQNPERPWTPFLPFRRSCAGQCLRNESLMAFPSYRLGYV